MLYSEILECKATSEDMFVHDIKAAPSHQCVLFCNTFCIFTADNLGEFYNSLSSVHARCKSKQHPTTVGPILVGFRIIQLFCIDSVSSYATFCALEVMDIRNNFPTVFHFQYS